jgi:hypothetical protein
MADETSQDQPPNLDAAATPNRDRRIEPPVIIEGDVAGSRESVDPPLVVDAPDAGLEAAGQPIAPPPPIRERPILSAAIGAIVGAGVAAAGLWYLEQRPAMDPEIVARIENLEKNPPVAALASLDRRVGALEAASGGASDTVSAAAFGQRITALESAALSAKAAADANKDALSTAQAARDDAAKALALATAATQKADGAAGAIAPPIETGADAGGLEGRVGKLEAGVAALDRPPVDLGPLNQRLDKLERALATPKTENRVPAESAPPGRDGAGLAVVAQALSDRLGAGAPFPLAQAALEHLGADPAKLAILKPFSEKGAPTAAALAADFAKISPVALAAAAPQGSGGVMDRLMANMSKVVRVTPVGEVAGDDPTALVSQIGAALGRGQIAPALAAWMRLPEPARQASQEWASAAQSRLAADKAAQGVLDDALASLAAAKN